MKSTFYILSILILTISDLKGQETISDWIDFDSTNINGVHKVLLYHIDNYRNDTVLVEENKYNQKGQIVKNTVYVDFTYEPLDSICTYLYQYFEDSISLKERSLVNFDNTKVYDIISYEYTYSGGKISSKTIHNVTSDDLEKESYYYDQNGKLISQIDECLLFLGDSSDYKGYWIFKYDLKENLVRKSYISDSTEKFAFSYSFDSLNNKISYKFIGIHEGGHDIDRYTIKYNNRNLKSFKESFNARGECWAQKYFYDIDNKLIKILTLRKYLKHKHYKKNKGEGPPPPPPVRNPNDYKKRYQKDFEYNCFYDSNGRLFKVTEKQFRFRYQETYIFKYE